MHRSARRRVPAVLLGVVLLAGCGQSGVAAPADPEPTVVAASSDSPAADGLAAGLLPASAFGTDATVTRVGRDDVRGLPLEQLAAAARSATVTPAGCADALTGLVAAAQGDGALDGAAAQRAQTGTSHTVQVLARGSAAGALDQLTAAAAACPTATVTVPGRGTATITTTPLPVPELGDGAAAVELAVTATADAGPTVSLPVLVGIARDGDRLVALATADQAGTPDRAAFLALLEQAYQVQADALG